MDLQRNRRHSVCDFIHVMIGVLRMHTSWLFLLGTSTLEDDWMKLNAVYIFGTAVWCFLLICIRSTYALAPGFQTLKNTG